jgi:molybdate transport system substrate-binding protein
MSSTDTARGAEITLVAPGGIRAALQQLLPAFARQSGHTVTPTFTSGGSAKAKTVDGELFDVPIVQPPLASVLASGNVLAASETALATVSVVVAVRSDIARPDISTGEAVKRLLLAAQTVACPSAARGAACGVSFDATLATLGITTAMAPKMRAAPGGWGAIEMLARGEVEIGITFASEIDPDPRVALLGALPRDISVPTGFTAFVHARSAVPDAAAALVAFLSAPDAAKTFEQFGMVPRGAARP